MKSIAWLFALYVYASMTGCKTKDVEDTGTERNADTDIDTVTDSDFDSNSASDSIPQRRQRQGVPWKNSQNARAPSTSWFWMPATPSHRAVTWTSMLGGTCPDPTKWSMDSASPEAHV